jgi:hypothetical protein
MTLCGLDNGGFVKPQKKTNFSGQSSSRDADGHSAGPEILHLLEKSNIHYCIHKSSYTSAPYLEQFETNPRSHIFYILTFILFYPPISASSPKRSPSFTFSEQNFIWILNLFDTAHCIFML